jgi:hypothetical protein
MAGTVALVLDREFGTRLRALSGDVWVVRSPSNSPVVDQLREANRAAPLTAFDDYGDPESEAFDEIVRTIELHHGRLSQDPPYNQLEVFGIAYDEDVAASLRSIGFELETKSSSSFTARRANV